MREGARDRATHGRLLRELDLDAALDVFAPAGLAASLEGRFRVVAWNLERCKRLEASAELLESLRPDLVLLSEMDWGMARSGNRPPRTSWRHGSGSPVHSAWSSSSSISGTRPSARSARG